MCPLRLILIFLSAALAGFFVLKNIKSQPESDDEDEIVDSPNKSESSTPPSNSINRTSKVCGEINRIFWICVDMASGRYLWRNLVSSSSERVN